MTVRPRSLPLTGHQREQIQLAHQRLIDARYDPESTVRDVFRRQLVRMLGELWDAGVSYLVMADALGISRQALCKLIATEERLRG